MVDEAPNLEEAIKVAKAEKDELRAEISQAMERQIRWMVTFNTALVALALAVARLLF